MPVQFDQLDYGMRRAFRAFVGALAMFTLGANSSTAKPTGLPIVAAVGTPPVVTRTKLSEGIYQFTTDHDGYVDYLNSVAIITDDDIWVFDTQTRPSIAAQILVQIRQLSDKPIRYIVNSHWHPDHWSGNTVYAQAYPEAQIISTVEERTYMKNVANAWATSMPRTFARLTKQVDDEAASHKDAGGKPMTDEQIAKDRSDLLRYKDMLAEQLALKRTYPTFTYTDQLVVHDGGREFHLVSMYGDAAGTTVLYLPNEKLLLLGDVVNYPIPYSSSHMAEHANSLRRLLDLDASTIVPGHGPAFHDKQFMSLELALYDEIEKQVSAALERGLLTVEDVQKAVKLDALRAEFTHGDSELNDEFTQYTNDMIRRTYIQDRNGLEFHQ